MPVLGYDVDPKGGKLIVNEEEAAQVRGMYQLYLEHKALITVVQEIDRRGEVRDYADLARLGYVTRARITQIMNLLNLAPDIQEAILFLPRTVKGRDPIREKDIRPIAAVAHWSRQRKMWARLTAERMS